MKTQLSSFLLLVLLISCNPSSDHSKNNDTAKETSENVKDSNEQTEAKTNQFNLSDTTDYDLSQLDHEGQIVQRRFWQDINGENIALFTINKEELFVYHYLVNESDVKLLRKVTDFERDCEFDLTMKFVDSAISITDLDDNDLGELTFAYVKACISDVSPKDLKLLMLENGNKYIIRGYTRVFTGQEDVGGNKTDDTSFNKAPKPFLTHANKTWDNILPIIKDF